MSRKITEQGDIPTDSEQLQYEEFYDGTNVNVFFANDN